MSGDHMFKIKMCVEGIRNPRTNALMRMDKIHRVEPSQFWLKRLNEGDCELAQEVEKKKQTKKKTSRKSSSVATPPVEPDLDPKVED